MTMPLTDEEKKLYIDKVDSPEERLRMNKLVKELVKKLKKDCEGEDIIKPCK